MNQKPSRFEMPDLIRARDVSRNSDSQLVLVVGDRHDALREAMTYGAELLGWRTVDVNTALPTRLIPLSDEERVLEAWDALRDVVGEHRGGVVLLTSDILFEPTLKYRPYEALRRLGRSGPVVAPWSGTVIDNDVVRAMPGHPEYLRVPLDVPFVPADRVRGGST